MSKHLAPTLMAVVEKNPSALLARFIRRATRPEPVGWLHAETLKDASTLHRALMFKVDGRFEILHLKIQLAPCPDMPAQIFEVHTALASELRHPRRSTPPPITSAVVLMTGPTDVYHTKGALRTSPPGLPFNGVRFEIDPVYQHPLYTLMTRRQPLWRIFAPLARDIDKYGLIAAMSDLQGSVRDEPTRRQVFGLMARLSDLNPRGVNLREHIEAFANSPTLPELEPTQPNPQVMGTSSITPTRPRWPG